MSKREQESHTEIWLCGSSELYSLQLLLRLNNLILRWLLTKEVCMNFATTWKARNFQTWAFIFYKANFRMDRSNTLLFYTCLCVLEERERELLLSATINFTLITWMVNVWCLLYEFQLYLEMKGKIYCIGM